MPGKKDDSSKKKSSSASKKKSPAQKAPSSKSSSKSKTDKKSVPAKASTTKSSQAVSTKESTQKTAPELDSALRTEFPELFKKIDKKFHEYLTSVINNPWRQFQKSTVDDYLKSVEDYGLPRAVAAAIDARDYTRGNSWEQANMNIMNNLLPRAAILNELLKEAAKGGCTEAIKWYPEASGNPKEIIEVMTPLLKSKEPKNRWWAAVHLSRHAPNSPELVDVLTEAVQADWIAFKLDNSSSGVSGKGEAAKALGRVGKSAAKSTDTLFKLLEEKNLESADAAHIASALLPISGDTDKIMSKVARIAERVLREKRGLLIHGGDRELLTTVRNLISKWQQSEGKKSAEMSEKVDMLEKEIKYHISL
jgi:hypothetical protein